MSSSFTYNICSKSGLIYILQSQQKSNYYQNTEFRCGDKLALNTFYMKTQQKVPPVELFHAQGTVKWVVGQPIVHFWTSSFSEGNII